MVCSTQSSSKLRSGGALRVKASKYLGESGDCEQVGTLDRVLLVLGRHSDRLERTCLAAA